MASNKNQHYVPQCYLRRFSQAESSAAIDLFNLDRKKLIKNAPIKNQCSKGYFYGEDLVLENALQPIEGIYSSVINNIQEPEYMLLDEHKLFLKRFWLLQNMRTEAASKRSMEMSDEMGVVAGVPASEYQRELKEAVSESMKIFYENIDLIDDLKVCLIKNKTSLGFITSDHPAILSNKWHILRKSFSGRSFGYGSAGVIALLPLTPRILFLAYDGDVYNVQHTNGVINFKNDRDVQALNEHQFLNCSANVYIQNPKKETELIADYEKISHNRPVVRHVITYSELDYVENGFKRYKVVKRSEANNRKDALLHCQIKHPHPSFWPSVVGWRVNGFVFTNGSGTGYIRKKKVQTMQGRPYKKVKA